MAESDISTVVNGKPVRQRVPNRAVLTDLLRDRLGLTGTKVSCGVQVCGACTVLVDGCPASACTYLASDVDGREVETIEGLADGARLHALQRAFVGHTALQCGYCTPGFIMAAKALLAEIPDPSRDQVIEALEGNICRCTGYLPIVAAVLDAARVLRGEAAAPAGREPGSDLDPAAVAGRPVERVDAVAKVTGAAQFAIDVRLPDMLEGCVVRSGHAHARIVAVRRDEALQVDGCVAVVTGADLGNLFARFGHIVPDHQILATDKVRYYGEPVALVLAEDIHAARDAAALVDVEYDDLPPVLDAAAALAPGAPLVHDHGYSAESMLEIEPDEGAEPNVAHLAERSWGDPDGALARAHVVVETRTHHPMLYAYAMEPYNAIARFADGNLDVIAPAQHPYLVVRDLARVFSLPYSRVRVSVPYIGGGYGSKSYTKIEPLAAVGAWYSNRPVRVVLDVEQAIYTTRADSADVVVRSGFDTDGTLRVRDIDVVLDTGAYADNSPRVLEKAVNRSFGPYRIPNLRVRGRAVYTNTSPASSYRALGAFQTNLAGETNMDQAAERLGIDPADLRRRNLVRKGEVFIPGLRPMDGDLAADLDELVSRLDVTPRDGVLAAAGFGCGANEGGAYPTSTAQVRIAADGSATVLSGSTELGQGSRTVLLQVASQELGLPLGCLRIVQSDTATTSYERTTGGSRTTTLAGLAVYRACHDALAKLAAMAAEAWDCRPDDVHIANAQVTVAGRTCSFRDVIRKWFGPGGGEVVGLGVVRRAGELEQLPVFWEVGMVGVTIGIDEETGKIDIDQLVTVADVGFAINPAGVEGQDLGAAMQGIGGALAEELVYDGEQIVNANLVEYRVPRITDAPRAYESVIAERRDGPGPYGAKGVGEGARVPVGGAVAAAVARAAGAWPDRLPLTPERVWRLLGQRRAAQ